MSSITAWRIAKLKFLSSAFTGEGSKRYGGRWNSVGTPVVYLAESRSLAVLELLVHVDPGELLHHYRLIPVTFERKLMKEISVANLPADWRRNRPGSSTRSVGDGWIASGESVVLRVPSGIVPEESNFLLNPRHADFYKVDLGAPQPFRFDRRLKH